MRVVRGCSKLDGAGDGVGGGLLGLERFDVCSTDDGGFGLAGGGGGGVKGATEICYS